MRREELEEIGMKLQVFSFSRLQELVTLSIVLKREGISIKKVKEFIKASLGRQQFQEEEFRALVQLREKMWLKNARKCPDCGTPMMLAPIKQPKGKGNTYGYSCIWFCTEEDCIFEEYTHEDFRKTYEGVMERR